MGGILVLVELGCVVYTTVILSVTNRVGAGSSSGEIEQRRHFPAGLPRGPGRGHAWLRLVHDRRHPRLHPPRGRQHPARVWILQE